MKAKSKSINRVLIKENCINFFIRYGYFIHSEAGNRLVMRKSGTQFSVEVEKFPKELAFVFNDQNTDISLKYDTFVLFDTGDLQEEFDLILKRISDNIDVLV